MSYKLSYFDMRGLAESIRLLLVDNNINFEDHRIPKSEWPYFKAKMPFGQVPCLFDGFMQIVQSGAIIRHLGRRHHLCGKNESEKTFIDMFSEGVRDLDDKYAAVFYQPQENPKEKFLSEILPEQLQKLERLFKTYNSGEKFVAGENVSYADYTLFDVLDNILIMDPHAIDQFPALKGFYDRFRSRQNLKKYLEKRAANKVPLYIKLD